MHPQYIAIIVYTSAILPFIILCLLSLLGKVAKWVWWSYIIIFLLAAFGWEIWFTYGLIDGQSVDIRRSEALNHLIPQNVNWLLNSLADAGIVMNGILYVWLFSKEKKSIFTDWRWKEFAILTIFFLSQNLVVELFIYQAQLAAGYLLSWAPFAPTGPWLNPELFLIGGNSVHLQTQLPWLIMLPVTYALIRKLKRDLG